MNRTLLFTVAATFACPAVAAPIANDGFDYGPLADLNGANGGTGWTTPWTDVVSSQITAVGGSGLTWPTLPTGAGYAQTPPGTLTFDAAYYRRDFTPPAHGPLYISFLLRPDANYGSYAGLEIYQYPGQIQFGTPMGYYLYGWRIGHYGFALSSVPVQEGRTTFLVLAIVPTTTTTAYNLYVDPRAQDPMPAFPSCAYVAGGTRPLPTYIYLTNDGAYTTDEIRIASTWEEAMGRRHCVADVDDGTGTGTCDGGVTIDDLLYYLNTFDLGLLAADVDDGTGTGMPDGGVTIDDLLYFLARFDAGC